MKLLNELLAKDRDEIISKCESLNKKFVEHFDKIYKYPKSESVNHWLSEMQAWYDQVKNQRFKYNGKKINVKQLFDWFFLGPYAACAADLFPDDNEDDDEAAYYLEFVDYILDEDMSIKDAYYEIEL